MSNIAVLKTKRETSELDFSDQIGLIEPITGIEDIAPITGEIAVPMDVDAHEIYVDHAYQRNISGEGQKLVRSMVRNWDWHLFERPLLWIDPKKRKVALDGQHTTKAWVSHPELSARHIPVNVLMGVHSDVVAAEIFMGRNMNRIRLHHLQEFKSALVAKKDWAMEMYRVAQECDVRIPFTPEFNGAPNTLMSLKTLERIMDRHGIAGTKRILNVLHEGAFRPIRQMHLLAMEHLLFDSNYKGIINVEKLKGVLRANNDNLMLSNAIVQSVQTKIPRWQTLAVLYYKDYQTRFGR